VVSPAPRAPAAGPSHLLTVSAATPAALDEATGRLAGQLESSRPPALAALERELHHERPALEFRRVVVAAQPAEAARSLRKLDRRRVFSARATPGRPVVYLFSGVGDQYPGLAAGLYRDAPQFRSELDRCFGLLRAELGTDLSAILYPAGAGARRPDKAAIFDQRRTAEEIHRTVIAQPLIFAVQHGMATALRALGAEPSALLGYSIGEYAAACQAGVLSLEDALRLVALRARLIADLPEGAMLAVMSGAGPLGPYLGGGLSVAALDGPRLTVLAGPPDDVGRAAQRLTDAGVACRQLPASHAYHSAMMEPAVRPLHDLLGSFALRPPAVPVLSNVTGTWLRPEEAISPGYWARHVRETVRFADDLAEVWRLTSPILVELGPGRALGQLAAQCQPRPDGEPGRGEPGRGEPGRGEAGHGEPGHGEPGLILHTLPGPFESRSETEVFLDAIGRLWAAGVEIKLSELPGWRTVADQVAHPSK
jgi:acyl transferase domain-containing protein